MNATKPSYEAVHDIEHSFRYLAHGADSSLVRWHYHKEFELHLIQNTRGDAFIGDYVGPFEPGTVFLCGPYLPHNWVSLADFQRGVRDRVINFTEERMQLLIGCFPEMRDLNAMLADSRYGIEFSKDISSRVIQAFTEVTQLTGMARVLKVLEIMTTLAESNDYRTLSSRTYEEESERLTEERANTVVDYIVQHCSRDLCLEEVANLLGFSPSFFSRWFKKTTGQRFIDFITRLRITRACKQLEDLDTSITTICFDVGFSNVANFNRHFLKVKGMTPRQYRESLEIRGRNPLHVPLHL